MTTEEYTERKRLHKLWIAGRANLAQMRRAMELDRKAWRAEGRLLPKRFLTDG